MTKYNPSILQIEIFKYIWFERKHLLINAVAGSGKTTTIVDAIKKIKNRSKLKIAFVAFNNHIVKELKSRLPSGITVSTLHSIGMNCIRRANGGKAPKVDEFDLSLKKLIRDVGSEDSWHNGTGEQDQKVYNKDLLALTKLCKLNLALTYENIEEVAKKYNFIDLEKEDFLRVEKLLSIIIEDFDVGNVSFDDMVFLPAIGKVTLHQYDYLFVDECQDLNRAQQECLRKMLKPDGRLIAVGDPKQAIYGFAGADSSSFKEFELFDGITVLPLSVCYRCSREVINFTQTVYPNIEVFDRALQGQVRYGSYKELEVNDFVLCRNNAPLTALHRILLSLEKPAYIKGQDIGKGLIQLINSLTSTTINDLNNKLLKRFTDLVARLKKSGLEPEDIPNAPQYQQVNEELQMIKIISKDCQSIGELTRKIGNIFTEDGEGIVLSSIHKSKGLESDRVFILYDDLTPSKQAINAWEIEQENNLIYVSYTRAKEELIFINDFELYDVPEQSIIWRSKRFEKYKK